MHQRHGVVDLEVVTGRNARGVSHVEHHGVIAGRAAHRGDARQRRADRRRALDGQAAIVADVGDVTGRRRMHPGVKQQRDRRNGVDHAELRQHRGGVGGRYWDARHACRNQYPLAGGEQVFQRSAAHEIGNMRRGRLSRRCPSCRLVRTGPGLDAHGVQAGEELVGGQVARDGRLEGAADFLGDLLNLDRRPIKGIVDHPRVKPALVGQGDRLHVRNLAGQRDAVAVGVGGRGLDRAARVAVLVGIQRHAVMRPDVQVRLDVARVGQHDTQVGGGKNLERKGENVRRAVAGIRAGFSQGG